VVSGDVVRHQPEESGQRGFQRLPDNGAMKGIPILRYYGANARSLNVFRRANWALMHF
jgi:hypothetical protein